MSKEKIGVIGAGLMGHGIAYRFAAAGHEVGIFEPAAELRETLATRLRAIVDLLAATPLASDGSRYMTNSQPRWAMRRW